MERSCQSSRSRFYFSDMVQDTSKHIYASPSTLSGTKPWIDINWYQNMDSVHDIEHTNNTTESDNEKETTETALINNKIKEIYENSHLCFQQAKLNELKSEDIMFIMIA